ncbi:MAG: prolyl oligopeptidase family serine peptidase [Planctomycetaceae bacterium]
MLWFRIRAINYLLRYPVASVIDAHRLNRRNRMSIKICLAWLLLVAFMWADGPADNSATQVRPIPPPGVAVPDADRQRLQTGLDALASAIKELRALPADQTRGLLPDVEIFHRAVDQALRYNEFFREPEIKLGDKLLAEGLARAQALLQGDAPWTRQTGLVVRGYRSKLDDTVQPYGLVIPASYAFDSVREHRCDLWFHGRGETACEVQFINQRMTQIGQIAPEDTIVLHPFGRYSNAFKFAGEVDVLEALEHARNQYHIDEQKVAVRGFSMGGAGVWHFAAHYPDRWFAATPGAGFSETPEFLKSFQGETLNPPWWEEKLWKLYDCPPWVANLLHCPTIAYSGEIDTQKQAADIMVDAFRKDTINELELVHLIGPETAHKLHPDALREIESRLKSIARMPRIPLPRRVRFHTYTLRYNGAHWLHINGLDKHWDRAEVDARMDEYGRITIYHTNVNDLTIAFPPGSLSDDSALGDIISPLAIAFHNPQAQTLKSEEPEFLPVLPADEIHLRVMSDGSFAGRFVKDGSRWRLYEPRDDEGLHKRPGLQGPIDDALMDSFLFVTPSGEARHPQVQAWVKSELDRAIQHWRQQMRGDVRIKADEDVTEEDIARHNLILWGDPQSNSLMANVLPKLPLKWTAEAVTIGQQSFPAAGHAPALVYPNPLNPNKYVVLNSSLTYREYDYLNNARQTPKLPDWAIFDLNTPPGPRWAGKVVAADFFDEQWEVQVSQPSQAAKTE